MGRTVLNLSFEEIYARTRVLFGIVPTRPAILYNAPEPLARKPCKAWLEGSTARVVEDQRSVDAVWVRKLQGM